MNKLAVFLYELSLQQEQEGTNADVKDYRYTNRCYQRSRNLEAVAEFFGCDHSRYIEYKGWN